MEKEKEIPQHILDYCKETEKSVLEPNIIRTRNITKLGLDTLMEKNQLEWSSSVYHEDNYHYMEGLIRWGKNNVWLYFNKIDSDSTYKLYILKFTNQEVLMLLRGLNKYFTIDRI
jgi:hypothetical protein